MTRHVEFPFGIPAFEAHRRFKLTEKTPLLFMESEANPALSFPLLPVSLIDPEYRLALSAEDRETIRAADESPLLCLAVVTAVEGLPPTANLLAPVVVNLDNGLAVQAVRSDRVYSHQHLLVPEEGASCS